jgi:hypothetical protein
MVRYALPAAGFHHTVRAMNPANDPIEEARRAGLDLDLLDSNLALTPEERALRHESALELMLALKEAGSVHEEPPSADRAVR